MRDLHEQLRSLVSQHGTGIVDNSEQFRGALDDYLTLLRHPASTRHRCRSQTLMWAATSPKRSNATPPRPPRQRDVRS